jgi:Prp8 binding protein
MSSQGYGGGKSMLPRYSQNHAAQYSSAEYIEKHLPNVSAELKGAKSQEPADAWDAGKMIEYYEQKKQELALMPSNGILNELQANAGSERRLFSPNISLTGHQGEVYCCKFDPSGGLLASAGHDKHIMLWEVFNSCANIANIRVHKNAILDMKWGHDSSSIFTCSADKTVAITDVETKKRTVRLTGHQEIVNSVDCRTKGNVIVASGGDDSIAKIWDPRSKEAVINIQAKYPILSVCFNDIGDKLFTSGSARPYSKELTMLSRSGT